jgi:hypothetical protein
MNERLREMLVRARNADGGWPYYAGRQSRIEPTCWAALALGDDGGAQLLASWQRPNGLLVEPATGAVNFAFNGLAALALNQHGKLDPARRVTAALVANKGVKVPGHPQVKQNTRLQGWSWYEGTFSWVEPTAWCLLAVKMLGVSLDGAADRISEAERLVADRACAGGGWNYGNSRVYGQNLLPHVPPSAVAVMALQDRTDQQLVREAVSYLRRASIAEGSTAALALTWLALAVIDIARDGIREALDRRAAIAEELGNICALAMMLYVVDLDRDGGLPMALHL